MGALRRQRRARGAPVLVARGGCRLDGSLRARVVRGHRRRSSALRRGRAADLRCRRGLRNRRQGLLGGLSGRAHLAVPVGSGSAATAPAPGSHEVKGSPVSGLSTFTMAINMRRAIAIWALTAGAVLASACDGTVEATDGAELKCRGSAGGATAGGSAGG